MFKSAAAALRHQESLMQRCSSRALKQVLIRTDAHRNALAYEFWRSTSSWATPQATMQSLLPTRCDGRQLYQVRQYSSAGGILQMVCPGFGAESITEGTVMEWRKNVGEFVAKGEILALIETDKVTVEVNAEESGIVKEILVPVDGNAEVGQPLVKIELSNEAPAATAAPVAKAPPAAPETPAAPAAPQAPVRGFLRAAFAERAAARLGTKAGPPRPPATPSHSAKAPEAPAAGAVVSSTIQPFNGERRVPINFIRQRIAQRIKDTQNTAALLTTFQEVDMTAALAMTEKYKELFSKTHGAPLGLLSLFVKASSASLADIPGVNAVIDDEAKQIVYRDYADISVPIPSPRGPISCVLRNVQHMSVSTVEKSIAELIDKARKDKISFEDVSEPTFGIDAAGVGGGMLGTPMINPPMSAILGCNEVKQRAAVVGGKVVARPTMYIALTYDHRLIDGREAVTFLCSVRDKVEDPQRLLLDV